MRRLDRKEYGDEVGEALDRFVKDARVRLALLVNTDGQVMAQQGFARTVDVMGAATLAAGIHSSSREMARLIGEEGFAHLHHRGGDRQTFLGRVPTPAEPLLLLTVFGSDSSVGLVQVFFKEFARTVADLPGWKEEPPTSGEEFEEELMRSLDGLFPED